jgi:hypothetical protein
VIPEWRRADPSVALRAVGRGAAQLRFELPVHNGGPAAIENVQILRLDASPVFQLELRQGRFCPPGIAQLDAVWVGYEVFGGRHEQRLPVTNPPRVRCP